MSLAWIDRKESAAPGRLGNMAAVDVFGVVAGVKPLVVSQGIADEAGYDATLARA